MRNRFQTRGVALIITLAMIAMLTFLIVAYFSRSLTNVQIESSSTSSSKADVLARTAAQIVVSDFKAEIIAGSNPSGTGTQARVYYPVAPANMVPAVSRSSAITGGNNAIFINLVKQSTGRFFPTTGYPNANPTIQNATEFSTDVVSANGRSMINKRWDDPANQLLPQGPLLLVSPPPPAAPPSYCRFYANSMLPHWVVMTRQGVPASQSWTTDWQDYSPANTKAAIGRFAFNAYDTSGLLDVNVAGYAESGNATLPPTVLGQKGALGLAQLSLIPGIDTPANAALFTQSWRNLATATTPNNYLAYLGFSKNGTTDLSGNSFFLAGPKTGFISAAAGASLADNRVLGRQDLIRLGIKTVGATAGAPSVYGLSFAALPNLTHFSRELNAPSWSPAKNASDPTWGGNDNPANVAFAPYAYLANKDNIKATNRFLPNVRVASGSGWQRLTGENAVPGEPLIKYRFPLSWLAVLQDADPTTPGWDLTAEAKTIVASVNARNKANGGPGLGVTITDQANLFVQRAFGLKWNTTLDPVTSKPLNRWDYTGSPNDGFVPTSMTTTIKPLGDPNGPGTAVTKDGREPNFFELLKAGILSGSLGNSSDFESMCSNIGEDSNPDNQIIQIGANIIDQADTDSYPTLIGFGYEKDKPLDISVPLSALNTPQNLPNAQTPGTPVVKVFAGVEDLPYIYTFLSTPYRIPPGEKNLRPDVDLLSPTQTQNAQCDVIDGWLQFVMWKPQQQATTTAAPTNFRISYTGPDIHLTISGKTGLNGSPPPDVFPAGSGITYGYRDTVPKLQCIPTNVPPDPPRTVSFNDRPGDFRVPTLLGGMGSTPDHGFNCSQPEGNGSSPIDRMQLPRGMWLGETYRPEYIATPGSPNNTAPLTTHSEFRCAPGSTFELQYSDGAGNWRTYQRYDNFGIGTGSYVYSNRGTFGYADDPTGHRSAGSPVFPANSGTTSGAPAYRYLDVATLAMGAVDPRAHRYGLMAMYLNLTATTVPTILAPPGVTGRDLWKYFLKQGWAPSANSQSYWMTFSPQSSRFSPSWMNGTIQNPWQYNTTGNPIFEPTKVFADNVPGTGATTNSYKDLDGVNRRADGDSTDNVRPMQLADAMTPNTQDLGRVINRPFRSVGELAYVFRDEPYKSLNLFTEKSADGALLDLFCVNDEPAMIAGKVNLNTKNAAVLQAVIAGAAREELSTTNTISAADALTMANNLISSTTATTLNNGPLLNPAEIATRLSQMVPPGPAPAPPDLALKNRREVVARALAGSGQTRTWNFLIDVVAQSGRYAPNATASSQFIVEGEKRYWLHVAIDRFTGQVIDQQLESVME